MVTLCCEPEGDDIMLKGDDILLENRTWWECYIMHLTQICLRHSHDLLQTYLLRDVSTIKRDVLACRQYGRKDE